MSGNLQEELKIKMREIVERKGVALDTSDLHEDWNVNEKTPEHKRYEGGFSYGTFEDYEAEEHVNPPNYKKDPPNPCKWVVPKGAHVQETSVGEFTGTFVDNTHYEIIIVWGCHCACGKFKNQPLQFQGTVSEVLEEIFKEEKSELTL